jgi:hypothetical protein
MTTRKSKGKGKRNGRTKRGGFLDKLFDKSYSWFGNNSESTEKEKDSSASASASDSGTGVKGWLSGLWNQIKPPPTPSVQPVIPGRPPMQPQPASLSSAASLSPQSLSQQPKSLSQQQSLSQPPQGNLNQMQPQLQAPASVKGGKRRRNRVSAKKRK